MPKEQDAVRETLHVPKRPRGAGVRTGVRAGIKGEVVTINNKYTHGTGGGQGG
jgi:hypothetical protein